ncbi:MAG: histidine triad nucleotide-binding protein [Alphaproteobacteria bacterium]|nr:histidine triad nucleotide-binding protein [Alphaproteobacteria bacterium]
MTTYDPDNILAKIIRGEIPSDKVYEDAHTLAIRDVAPKAPTHVLVVPKGAYRTYDDFLSRASDEEILALQRAIAAVIKVEGVAQRGYRLVMNNAEDGRQEIPHLHCHVIGGAVLGSMV